MSMGDGKARNVIEYLDNLIEKGKASKGAIKPLRITFAKVLQIVDGEEGWQETEVKGIDVEDYMARFANLTMGRYSSDSLAVYKSRVNKVVSWYLQFLEKPGWTPDVQKRNRLPKPATDKKTAKSMTNASGQAQTSRAPENPDTMSSVANTAGRILYPYPLLDGQLIHISLPVKLLKTDAKRIAAFVESIAIEAPSREASND